VLDGDRHAPLHSQWYNDPRWSSAVQGPVQSTTVHGPPLGPMVYFSPRSSRWSTHFTVNCSPLQHAFHSLLVSMIRVHGPLWSTPVHLGPLWSSPWSCFWWTPVDCPLWSMVYIPQSFLIYGPLLHSDYSNLLFTVHSSYCALQCCGSLKPFSTLWGPFQSMVKSTPVHDPVHSSAQSTTDGWSYRHFVLFLQF